MVLFSLLIAMVILFFVWLSKQTLSEQFRAMGSLAGAILLYGSLIHKFTDIARPYEVVLAFFLSIVTVVGLNRIGRNKNLKENEAA